MKNPFRQGTHNHFIFQVLSNGSWYNVIEIMRLYGNGIVNMAIRSRVADMRKYFIKNNLPYEIEARIGENRQGEYRLVEKPTTPCVETYKPVVHTYTIIEQMKLL